MKDERIAQMRELLAVPAPEDQANLRTYAAQLKSYLQEATTELRDAARVNGGDFGSALRAMLEDRILEQHRADGTLPPGTEVVSMMVHLTSEGMIVDVRLKLVPYLGPHD